ncbi:helix-turn-helix domain-containing protein [Streptomyces sp. NBC_00306]|uniref:helix-turn-helix domain-containing protein n=1 Tax=Streptomyces sp. NBC_00306 TaxID=2975708 RepID=UPI002E298996|nr:helix-turn-helix transcriptional regulator [Streptomyces sp. NBC_00306]
MVANSNPTARKRRLGAELRRLRMTSGLKGTEVAERLLVSQPKISHMENGRRAIRPRDVRDLCELYGVADQQVVAYLMQMAKESSHQGWWRAYGDIPQGVYIGLETDATSLHTYQSLAIPDLLQTPAYAQAVIKATVPQLTAEQAATRLKVQLHRQRRIHDPACPLRLWLVLDESALRRVVGSPHLMREQLEHLNARAAEPHINVQVIPYTAGAHPGMTGQFSILQFDDSADPGVVHLERFTSDLYLEKPSDVQHYSMMYDHLQAHALNPDRTRDFISDAVQSHVNAARQR